jgi:hypothetical protein
MAVLALTWAGLGFGDTAGRGRTTGAPTVTAGNALCASAAVDPATKQAAVSAPEVATSRVGDA